jgi:peptide/nickel transport system permease protein
VRQAPWVTGFAGLAILVAVLAFNLLGDALRDVMDPRLRGEGVRKVE